MTTPCTAFCIAKGHHRADKEYGEEDHHRGHRVHREKIKSFLIIIIRNISKHTDNNGINI
jgi:hypothetical protein